MAKLVATEAGGRVVDRCMQMFGGFGVQPKTSHSSAGFERCAFAALARGRAKSSGTLLRERFWALRFASPHRLGTMPIRARGKSIAIHLHFRSTTFDTPIRNTHEPKS